MHARMDLSLWKRAQREGVLKARTHRPPRRCTKSLPMTAIRPTGRSPGFRVSMRSSVSPSRAKAQWLRFDLLTRIGLDYRCGGSAGIDANRTGFPFSVILASDAHLAVAAR